MSTSAGITHLATELLASIFAHLGLQDMLRCKEVCQAFNRVINESVELQYKMECDIYGVVDGDTRAFSVAERLQRLREQQEAWVSGTPTEIFQVGPGDWTAFGSVIASPTGELGTSLRIIQIPSEYRNIPRKEWTLDDFAFPFQESDDFTIDHSQHLLIVFDTLSEAMAGLRFQLLDLETGRPHPLAESPVIEVGPVMRPFQVEIMGDVFGVLWASAADEYQPELRVWNWKTSEIILNVFGLAGCRSFAIIDGPYVLLSSERPPPTHSSILVLPCNSDRRIHKQDAPWVAELIIPEEIYVLQISLDTAQIPTPRTVVPFYADPTRRFLRINIQVVPNQADLDHVPDALDVFSGQKIDLFIPLLNITTILPEPRHNLSSIHSLIVPWSQWSTSVLTILNGDVLMEQRTTVDVVDVRGTRMFICQTQWDKQQYAWSSQYFHRAIFDFNALAARRQRFVASLRNKPGVDASATANGLPQGPQRTTLLGHQCSLGNEGYLRYDWIPQEVELSARHRKMLLNDGIIGVEISEDQMGTMDIRYIVRSF